MKAIVPSQRSVKPKNNKTIFGFIKNLIGTSDNQLPEEKKEVVVEERKDEERKDEERPNNNRRRNNNNNRNRNRNRGNLNTGQSHHNKVIDSSKDKAQVVESVNKNIPAINEASIKNGVKAKPEIAN